MVELDEIFLDWLIDKTWEYQTLALPNPSVGALVVDSKGAILSCSFHQKSGEAHAELEAVREALEGLGVLEESKNLNAWELYEKILNSHNGALRECKIYCTLEPCNHEGKTPSCSKLLANLGIKKVIYACKDSTPCASGGGDYLRACGIEVVECLRERAEDLLYPFLCLQTKGHFNLYKIAQRLNGNYKGGQISSPLSKAFTHTQRGVAQSLIISGKTILNDKPRLDLRCAFRKDREEIPIKILTTQNLAPKDYECIASSNISIHHDIHTLGLESGFNLIEGGYTLLESLRDRLDCLLLLYSPSFEGESERVANKLELKLLHAQKLQGGDVALWLRP